MPSATGTEQAVCSIGPRGPFDLDQTHAATGHRVQLGMAAKDRDFDAKFGGGVHHQGALGYADRPAVDRQVNKISHVARIPFNLRQGRYR